MLSKIKQMIGNDNIKTDTLIEDAAIDSMGLIELVLAIEDEYQIEVQEDLIDSFKTFGDIIKYVQSKHNLN